MHALKLTDLAILFARHAMSQFQLGCLPPREYGNSYWLASRFRHEEWSGRLASHRMAIQRPGVSHRSSCWWSIYPVMQEVLLAEPLTRLLAYFGSVQQTCTRKAKPSASSDFAALAETTCQSHTEARNRCLNLIVFGQGLSAEHATQLNRLRRSMEVLTDQLLATLPQHTSVEQYGFDVAQIRETHHALFAAPEPSQQLKIFTLALSAQLGALRPELDQRAGSARLNGRLGSVVLKLFPPEAFDSFGVAKNFEAIRVFGDGISDQLNETQPAPSSHLTPQQNALEKIYQRKTGHIQKRF